MNRVALAMRELRQSLQRIKDLAGWKDLKKSESGRWRTFTEGMYDPVEFDLKAEVGAFLLLVQDLHAYLLDRSDAASARCKERISRIEDELWKLCPDALD